MNGQKKFIFSVTRTTRDAILKNRGALGTNEWLGVNKDKNNHKGEDSGIPVVLRISLYRIPATISLFCCVTYLSGLSVFMKKYFLWKCLPNLHDICTIKFHNKS